MDTKHSGKLAIGSMAFMCILMGGGSLAQQRDNPRVVDTALGIAFTPMGSVQKSDSGTYAMTGLSSSGVSALAEVSVSDRLFVDLPGSYGGRLYLDSPPDGRILPSRVMVDSVVTAGYKFRREYWAVYAGMGMWEGVINCYARVGGRYYIVSLIQATPLGKPGEQVDGKPLGAEELKTRLLSSLRDSTGVLVGRFADLLSSVQITGQ